MFPKTCLNKECKEATLEVRKGYKLYENGRLIYIPDVEVLYCPVCHEETFDLDAIKKINSAIDKASRQKPVLMNRIKEAREEKGWTQEELGNILGVTKQRISAIENNKAESQGVSGIQMFQIAEILEKPIDWLWYLAYIDVDTSSKETCATLDTKLA